MTCPVCFLIHPRTICPGMTLLTHRILYVAHGGSATILSNSRYSISYDTPNTHDEVQTYEHGVGSTLWYDFKGRQLPISLFLLPLPYTHTPKFHNDMCPWQCNSVTAEPFPVFFQCFCVTSTVLPIHNLRNRPTASSPPCILQGCYTHSQCALHVMGSLLSCITTVCPNHQLPVYLPCTTCPLLDPKINPEVNPEVWLVRLMNE